MKRVYHTWDEWECYPAGFYEDKPVRDDLESASDEELAEIYAALLRDRDAFATALERVLREWPNSVEHYLSNERMNRLAWLGQAALCIEYGIPSRYRGGFMLLTQEERDAANMTALVALNGWLEAQDEAPISIEEAASKTQMDLY